MKRVISLPASGSLSGEIVVPADKSIVHRSVMFNSLAKGNARVSVPILGRDNLATIRIMRQLGVGIDVQVPQALGEIASAELAGDVTSSDTHECVLKISGAGIAGLKPPTDNLDCGNSGTTARLMCGVLAGTDFSSTLDGDASLRKRPFGRVTLPLSKMGAKFSGERLPLSVEGSELSALDYVSPIASAQVKSAILLAGLRANGTVSVREPFLSRDHTERMLRAMGVDIKQRLLPSGEWLSTLEPLKPGQELRAIDLKVPSDISQAGFFLVAALLTPGSQVLIKNICFNPTRSGLFHVLRRMGAVIEVSHERVLGGEDVVDLTVETSALRGVNVDPGEVVSCVDEIPILCVAAAAAKGTTRIDGIGELRVKESDRVAMIESLLRRFGVKVSSGIQHIEVDGVGALTGLQPSASAEQDWAHCGDHRILMSAAVLNLVCCGEAEVVDLAAIETSFPNFLDCFQELGCELQSTED
ncbi:MAG: 3-phosphoshikimate 1-carboxyvinyltransferase [Bdellovibrionales bacterium]|nr:3-phosphoshikimate 1-carboxyvinyltransferase [Bdellovibrionales bacterium]